MKTPSLVDIGKSSAELLRYQEGNLWYRLEWVVRQGLVPELGHFEFPVPISDAGGGEFLPFMRGMQLMRWARKHLEMIDAARKEQEAQLPETD